MISPVLIVVIKEIKGIIEMVIGEAMRVHHGFTADLPKLANEGRLVYELTGCRLTVERQKLCTSGISRSKGRGWLPSRSADCE
jgi:hypothetical protein